MTDTRTDEQWKVGQYSVGAESATENQANSIRKAKEPSEEYKKGKIWPPNFLLPTTCTKYTWPGARPPVRRVLLGVKTCFTQNLNVLAHILVL